MSDLPPWATNAIVGVLMAVLGFFLSRRLNSATVGEKEANTAHIMSGVASDLARQVKAFAEDIPVWMGKLAAETVRAEKAEKYLSQAKAIRIEAKTIVEEMSHISYLKSPDEDESSVERRFKNAKAAAARIAEVILED